MGVKANENTIFLVIGFVIILIAKHFYDPLQLREFIDATKYSKLDVFVVETSVSIFIPIVLSFVELLSYAEMLMTNINNSTVLNLLCGSVLLLSYCVIVFFLEKIHSELHKEEGLFVVCINMICLENIAMYIYKIIIYHITQWITNIKANVVLIGIIMLPILLCAMCAMIVYLAYIITGFTVSCLPVIVLGFFESKINGTLYWIILIPSMLFCSQVLWRIISAQILDYSLSKISGGNISLDL